MPNPNSYLILLTGMHEAYTQQLSAYYQICINMLRRSHLNESWTITRALCLSLASFSRCCRGGEEQTDVFRETNIWFTRSTSQGVQVSAGCHLRDRRTPERPPTTLISSQIKTEAPWSTLAGRRSRNMTNRPMQTASSTTFDSIAQISTFGPNL